MSSYFIKNFNYQSNRYIDVLFLMMTIYLKHFLYTNDFVFAFACYHDWKTLGFVVKHLLGEDVPKIQGFFLTYEVCIKHRDALYIIIWLPSINTRCSVKMFLIMRQLPNKITNFCSYLFFVLFNTNHDCGCIITIAHFESKCDEMSVRKAPDLGHSVVCISLTSFSIFL